MSRSTLRGDLEALEALSKKEKGAKGLAVGFEQHGTPGEFLMQTGFIPSR